jgi:hypothetical protein
MDFNIRFSGDYDLFKWIIAKYKHELPYCGEIGIYTVDNHYSKNNSTWFWKERGVPTRAWNGLWKDLVIARLMGRIKEEEVRTLEQLEEEFNNLK